MNLEQDINACKEMLDNYEWKGIFSKYCPCYIYTTERMKEYLQKINPNTEKVLTVLSSGDHVFNLASLGILNIDTFDINIFCYYMYYFKRAIILSHSLKSFLGFSHSAFYFRNLEEFIPLLDKIKTYMPDDVYKFFNTLALYQYEKDPKKGLTNIVQLECIKYDFDDNFYANDKECYRKLQRNLEKLIINFNFCDIRELILKDNYDLILISNILDRLGNYEKRLTLNELKSTLLPLFSHLNYNGMLIGYLFYYQKVHYFSNMTNVIFNCDAKVADFGKENIFQIKKDRPSTEAYFILKKDGKTNLMTR